MSIDNLSKQAVEFQTQSNDTMRNNDASGEQFDPDLSVDVDRTDDDNQETGLSERPFDPDERISSGGELIENPDDNELNISGTDAEPEAFDPDKPIRVDEESGVEVLDNSGIDVFQLDEEDGDFNPDKTSSDEKQDRTEKTNREIDSEDGENEQAGILKDTESESEQINELWEDYIAELKALSEYQDTIDEKNLMDFKPVKVDKEVVKERRHEYDSMKDKIFRQWENTYGREWPRYKEDVYSVDSFGNKTLIRRAGDRYDGHHKKPLSMGGTNEVSNITPMHASVHSDHKGIHKGDGAYGKLEKMLEGKQS